MGRALERSNHGRILVVEDDDAARFGLVSALRARHFEVDEASSCDDALRLFESRPDVVISDLRLPDGDAIQLLPRLRAIDPAIPVYVITGFATIDTAVRAVKEGAEEFFTKPIELAHLIRAMEGAIESRMRQKSGPRALFDIEAARARSEPIRRLDDEVARLQNSDCTVLILGETGTGKTRLARRIHQLGARGKGPFVDVNCAGLSRDFVEAELFGHERGAFTGAHTQKQGLLEVANGGTVFLDEIGDIDVQVQPKILKVLEERRFRRMGDVRERNADVRLIAATHLDLLDAVDRRMFRADLFYRISTVTLKMPALRERIGDLVLLTQEILADEGAAHVQVTPDAWDKLHAYSWPGNIRELKNVMQRAVLLGGGDVIAANDVRFDGDTRASAAAVVAALLTPLSPVEDTLEEMERTHIRRALSKEKGRVKDAALRLGIPRSTLYQKIKNYGIRLPFRD
jgi:DNA-binding NtrC family response regulator